MEPGNKGNITNHWIPLPFGELPSRATRLRVAANLKKADADIKSVRSTVGYFPFAWGATEDVGIDVIIRYSRDLISPGDDHKLYDHNDRIMQALARS